MTKTQTESFEFRRNGVAYNGSPLWDVFLPGGDYFLGHVAKSQGKRGATWVARWQDDRDTGHSCGGFRSREAAAQFLARQES